MKIIYDNIIFSLQKAGGISLYWSELIKRLRSIKDITYFELDNKNIFRKHLNISYKLESKLPLKILRYLPFRTRLPGKSIFHSSYYRISLQKNIVNIITVHDFTYEYYRSGIAKYIHIWQKHFAIKNSDGIICISENTKNDLIKLLPSTDISKIKVIYNGVGEEFFNLDSPKKFLEKELTVLKEKKYILYIGDRSRYKNFDIAVNVLNKLADFTLVVVGGQKFTNNENEQINNIKNRTFHLQSITGEELNILYNNAFCLLYPSSYEGFGIPVAEAMKAGCPVISTNLSSIPEVAGKGALLVDTIKVDIFIQEIKKLENMQFRNNLINKGLKQVGKFSWDKCFDETYKFYEDVYKRKFS